MEKDLKFFWRKEKDGGDWEDLQWSWTVRVLEIVTLKVANLKIGVELEVKEAEEDSMVH